MSLPKPYYDKDGITIYCADCREVLPFIGEFDLCLTDPPYGIDGTWKGGGQSWGKFRKDGVSDCESWDIRDTAAVHSLLSYADDAVIWGGNYFSLPPTASWLVWDKIVRNFSSGHMELAWTTGKFPLRAFNFSHGELASEGKSHPTQKPLKLITWCLSFFPNAQSILDPFMGSGTTLVAAKQLGRRAVGIEIEEKYCEIAVQRLAQDILDFEGAA